MNAPASPEQRKTFVDRVRQTPPAQFASLHIKQQFMRPEPPLTFRQHDQCVDPGGAPLSPPSFLSPFDENKLHGHNKFYKDLEEAEAAIVPVSTVHVRLDVSKGG